MKTKPILFAVLLCMVLWSSVFAGDTPYPCQGNAGTYIQSVCVDMTTGNVDVGRGNYPTGTPSVTTWQSGDATFANQLKANPQMGYAQICQNLLPYFPNVSQTPVALSNGLRVAQPCADITTMQMQGNYVAYSIGNILAMSYSGDTNLILRLVAQVPYPASFITATPSAQPSIVYLASMTPLPRTDGPNLSPEMLITPAPLSAGITNAIASGINAVASASPTASTTPTPPPSSVPMSTPPPSVTSAPMTCEQNQAWIQYTFCQSVVTCLQKNVDQVAQTACLNQASQQYAVNAANLKVNYPAPNSCVSGTGDIATWNDRPGPWCPVDLTVERKVAELTAKILAVKGADYFMSSEEVEWVREIAAKGCEPIETRLAASGGMMYRLWRAFRLIPGVCSGV